MLNNQIKFLKFSTEIKNTYNNLATWTLKMNLRLTAFCDVRLSIYMCFCKCARAFERSPLIQIVLIIILQNCVHNSGSLVILYFHFKLSFYGNITNCTFNINDYFFTMHTLHWLKGKVYNFLGNCSFVLTHC